MLPLIDPLPLEAKLTLKVHNMRVTFLTTRKTKTNHTIVLIARLRRSNISLQSPLSPKIRNVIQLLRLGQQKSGLGPLSQ